MGKAKRELTEWDMLQPQERAAQCRKVASGYPYGHNQREKILEQANRYERGKQ